MKVFFSQSLALISDMKFFSSFLTDTDFTNFQAKYHGYIAYFTDLPLLLHSSRSDASMTMAFRSSFESEKNRASIFPVTLLEAK